MRRLIIGAILLLLGACVQERSSVQVPQPLLNPANDGSATVYFIITGDTDNRYNCLDPSGRCPDQIISKGFAANVGAVSDVAREISRLPTAPGVAPIRVAAPVVLTGNHFTCEKIGAAIDSLPIRPGIDMVWFHHSGHGRNDGHGLDPEFQLLQCGPYEKLSVFRAKILAKQPRLALIFADSCNIDETTTVPPAAAAPLIANYLPLLTNYAGWLMGGAARPGEFAWYTADGGTYTVNLLMVLRASNDWDKVINSPMLRQLDTPGAANARQHPIFKNALQRI